MKIKGFKKIKIRNLEVKKSNLKEDSDFLPLYPNYNSDNQIYVDRLLNGIEDEKIFNIGLTGPYGSGKSSILDGFYQMLDKKKYKPIIISLATFKENDNKEDAIDNELEIGILQQLIYKVSPRKIPLSKIVRIKEEREWIFLLICSIIFHVIFSGTINSTVEYFYGFIPNLFFKFILHILTFGFIFFMFNIVFRKFNISNLSFKGIELTIDKNPIESILNKYIDEIMYIFKKSKYNLVIFEDIDRFKNQNIFYKLRELNKILNDNEDIRKNGTIKFIYAIRDDVLKKPESRTKFFDLIIPVIPVISNTNAQLKFISVLKELGLKDMISKNIIEDISYFINDMRVVINICNEFKIYYEKVYNRFTKEQKEIYSMDKLFAIIAYKNLRPEDFSNMQCGKGYFNFLEDIRKDIKKYVFNTNIDNMEKEKQNITNEFNEKKVLMEKKLKEIFIGTYEKRYSRTMNRFETDKKSYPSKQNFIDNASIKELLSGTIKGDVYSPIKIEDLDVDEDIDNYNNFIEKENEKIKEIETKIRVIRKTDILSMKLSDVFVNDNELNELLDYYKKLKEDDDEKIQQKIINIQKILNDNVFLAFIRNEYLTEDYRYYINNLYLDDMTIEEFNYVANVKTYKKVNNYDIEIKNFNIVESKFKLKDYNNRYILNVDYIEYIFDKENSIEDEKIKIILDHIEREIDDKTINDMDTDFLTSFIRNAKSKSKLLNYLFNYKSNLWTMIDLYSGYNVEQRYEIFKTLINHLNKVELMKLLKDKSFRQYIEDYKEFNNDEILKIANISLRNNIDIKFKNIEKFQEESIKLIVQNFMYSINISNIEKIIDTYKLKVDNQDYLRKLYLLQEKNEKKIIENNIDVFISTLLEKENYIITTEEFIFVMNSNCSEENRKLFWDRFDGKIEKITEINNKESWKDLFVSQKIKVTLENILEYYKVFNKDAIILENIEENIENIILEIKLLKNSEEFEIKNDLLNVLKSLIKDLIYENDFSNDVLFKLLNEYDDFKIEMKEDFEFIDERLEKIVDKNIIEFNEKSYNLLKDTQYIDKFILNNIEKFFEIYNKIEVEEVLVGRLFKIMNNKDKHKLLINSEYKIFIDDEISADNFLIIINKDSILYLQYFDYDILKTAFKYSKNDSFKIKTLKMCVFKIRSKEKIKEILSYFSNAKYKLIMFAEKDSISFNNDDPICGLIDVLKREKYVSLIRRNNRYHVKVI